MLPIIGCLLLIIIEPRLGLIALALLVAVFLLTNGFVKFIVWFVDGWPLKLVITLLIGCAVVRALWFVLSSVFS